MTDHGTSRLPVCADRKHSASQRVANEKAPHNGRAFSELLVAWGGIEPPTQGFSDSDNRAKPVVQLAFLVTSVFGVLQTSSSNSALQRVQKLQPAHFKLAI